MQSNSIPSKFPIPWANSAGASYIRSIPTTSQIGITPGAASLTDGFPPLNSVPVAAGGTPPFMQDINGILNIMTGWLQWYQVGGPISYDAAFQATVGGYPNNARVLSTTTTGRVWQSTIDNNTSNPDAGGFGWVSANSGRLINIKTWMTAGTYTYAPSAGTASIVVTVLGGGGAGGGTDMTNANYSIGSGGAAGSAGKSLLRTGFSGITLVVGAGGPPVVGGWGGSGGTSSFGTLLSAPGGGGGQSTATTAGSGNSGQGASGAIAVGGTIFNVTGQPGACGIVVQTGAVSGQGGASILGGGGINTNNGSGNNAQSAGAGGGGAGATGLLGATGSQAGGAGAAGAIIIEEYA